MSRAATGPTSSTLQSELAGAMQACRNALIGVGIFSAVSNILMLTGSVFMLEVYDRVLPSRSVPTLIGLCVIAAFLFMMLGVLDLIRSRIMVRIATAVSCSSARPAEKHLRNSESAAGESENRRDWASENIRARSATLSRP